MIGLTGTGLGQFSQTGYNHPELNWHTFETDHFRIHYHDETEPAAREAATVAERIYPGVTKLYEYEPRDKTHLVLIDTDDYSNGAAYFYDNKIVIWATPLEYELRGSHRWLQNVITHEFTHIVSMQTAMKAGSKFPALYLQGMGYEEEKRKDVLYGFPNSLVSYPVPGTTVPPWLAEGAAQYMYPGADWDNWDSHRDMILRDRVLNDNLLSFAEINTFGKKGIGNESVYNTGYALSRYIGFKYGPDKLSRLFHILSSPRQFSINSAMGKVFGEPGTKIYQDFSSTLKKRYDLLTEPVRRSERKGRILESEGTANLHPVWSPDGHRFAYLSNKRNEYFQQTDLYIHDLTTGMEERIESGVHSAPAWSWDGTKIIFSKKPDFPDRNGSRFYELFEYDFATEKTTRLTRGARAFSPVYLKADSSLAFIATRGGSQNLYWIDPETKAIQPLTQFRDQRILSNLAYDALGDRLIFDVTSHHFRDIGFLSLRDSTLGMLLNNEPWDERDFAVSFPDPEDHQGDEQETAFLYSDDRSGIFNLYHIDPMTGRQGYVTNVTGGAFMPSINQAGQVLYSLYEDGRYTIALVDSLEYVEESQVGYSPVYFARNNGLKAPITEQNVTSAHEYEDQFPSMFILPKIMVDYGTLKPGFYFYSSEVLNRLSLFGGASINSLRDMDLFFLFDFRRFYPTLFLEFYYLTRNIEENLNYFVYDIDDNLKFRLIHFRGGLRFPLFGISRLELYTIWQRYRAFVKESIPAERLEVGAAYDYYRGLIGGLRFESRLEKARVDGNINPSNGGGFLLDITREYNLFIEGLDFSDAGTLVETWNPNNFTRIQIEGDYHLEIPYTNRWTVSLTSMLGWLSKSEVDSFFHFFGGGLPGLRGYPFYSIEGTRLGIGELAFRIPILRGQHIPLGVFTLQNSVLGFIFQVGDAWRGGLEQFSLKRSAGIQWRINGYSFYNFPTALAVELHQGLDRFNSRIEGETIEYGKEMRTYLSLLFEF